MAKSSAKKSASEEKTLTQASDPETTPEALERLGRVGSPDVRREVAKNPNASLKTLFALGEEFPRELFENPVFPMMLLENPRVIDEIPIKTLSRLFQIEELPDYFLLHASAAVKLAAARLKKLPRRVLERLGREPDEAVRLEIVSHEDAPADLLEWLSERSTSPAVQRGIAKHTNAPRGALLRLLGVEELSARALARERLAQVEEGIAARQFTWSGRPEEEATAAAGELRVREAVAGSSAQAAILERLARDEIAAVRAAVAQNPEAPRELVEALIGDRDRTVREAARARALAWRPAEAAELKELAAAPDKRVRMCVARARGAPGAVLARLARDRVFSVRRAVAENPGAPAEVLAALADDRDLFVRAALAENPGAPREALARLAEDTAAEIRAGIARHPGAPEALLSALERDGDARVLSALAARREAARRE
jgi:hypothetical protein